MADQFEGQWETLDNDSKKEVLGKLKGLEELMDYINLVREGYTRLLKVNGVKPDGTWEEKEPERLVTISEESEVKIKVIDIDTESEEDVVSPAPNHASP
tara:strand:+ start:223 stop:519 length:297 start_codon:yes stop_codon:yes gene_type:complete